jgi:serine/threonine protein kinase
MFLFAKVEKKVKKMEDRCRSEWKIRGDHFVGEGAHGQVYEACLPKELENKSSQCGQVVKIQDLLQYQHKSDEALLRNLWLTRQQLQKQASKARLAPQILDDFVCSNLTSLRELFDPISKQLSMKNNDPYGVAIMKWASGRLLSNQIESILKKPVLQQEMCQDLKMAVEKLHALGIYHGDLKPANIFVDPIEFIDFSNSWPMSDDPKLADLQKKIDLYYALAPLACKQPLPFPNPSEALSASWSIADTLRERKLRAPSQT